MWKVWDIEYGKVFVSVSVSVSVPVPVQSFNLSIYPGCSAVASSLLTWCCLFFLPFFLPSLSFTLHNYHPEGAPAKKR